MTSLSLRTPTPFQASRSSYYREVSVLGPFKVERRTVHIGKVTLFKYCNVLLLRMQRAHGGIGHIAKVSLCNDCTFFVNEVHVSPGSQYVGYIR